MSTFGSEVELPVGETIVTVVSSSKFGSKSRSSEASVSSASRAESGGGDDGLAFSFFECFPFLGMIEFAHDFTLRGLRWAFRDDLALSLSSVDSSSSGVGDTSGDSSDLERAGSDALVGIVGTVLSWRRDSKRKKPRRLAGTRVAGTVGDIGEIADMGRFRSEGSPRSELLMKLSRTAPAVLGRLSSSTVVREERPARAVWGLLPPTMDERLLVAEWPRNVDSDVSVSDDMVERGRIYSILSENPTRALDGGRALKSSSALAFRNDGCEMDLLKEWPNVKWLPSEGVLGALPGFAGVGGFIIDDRS